ncbi:Zn(2)-C6 fungal-type domain-containing protein [Favolaschia claudopus]|uniref:Zn(2)-C6 fungal-type domain-containing protein n=1 Tax=Favolaschia claudopus TaxID=2862362 RepID=A0AAW0E996_9AGAR
MKSEWDDSDVEQDNSEDTSEEDDTTDIRNDFECVLDAPIDFTGSYYFQKSYNEFPNPLLRLDSLGHIGLPLSTREAKQIIAHCEQAPFGQGERTLVDKAVRDTWEMDASKVHFDSPAWKGFMNKVSQEVCTKLGLAAAQISTVRCEAYKLLLYETGSHFLPHQDTEKTKGMFATIVVVLPSPFKGGEAHLSHAGLSACIDSSVNSLSNVSVLAWYTDVLHEIKPITGGYRLAISFNLIQTANSLPKLPEANGSLDQLRQVLMSWRKQPYSDAPAKLIYLLKHKYSQASLRENLLKGADAYKVALLDTLAKELQFDLGLAIVECHVSGSGDSYGPGDDAYVTMADIDEQTMTIGNLVDLDGRLIQAQLEYEEDDSEFCPENLRETVEGGSPDKREYEGYQGNYAGSLDLWYRRTVLVIWPHYRNAELVYGNNPDRALGLLTGEAEPNEECRLVAKFLLRGIASNQFGSNTIRGLFQVALRWKNIDLWLKTLGVCHPTQILGILPVEKVVEAIKMLGFGEPMKNALARILAGSTSNSARMKLLDSVAEEAEQRGVNDWLAQQRDQVVKTLKKPSSGEEELLVRMAVEGGGVSFLQNIILPQIITVADVSFLVKFTSQIVKENSFLQTEQDKSVVQLIAHNLLATSIDKINFFSPTLSSAAAYFFICACVRCSHDDLAEVVINRLLIASLEPEMAMPRTCNVLVPLVPQLKTFERPVPGFVNLCRATVENYLKFAQGKTPTDPELSGILDAVVGAGEKDMLPKLLKQMLQLPPNVALCQALIKNLRSRENDLTFDNEGGLSAICTEVVQNLIQRTQYYSNPPLIGSHTELCFSTDNMPTLSQLFGRILVPAPVDQRYISEILLPLVKQVHTELARRGVPADAPPFQAAYKQILELYASKVLGRKTADHDSLVASVRQWKGCCTECASVIQFFLQSRDRQITLRRIGKPRRTHVEQKLSQFCGYKLANWRTITTTPQGLEVNKSDLLYSSIVWAARQAKLKEVLDFVGRDNVSRVFGSGYGSFMKSIGEEVAAEAGPSGPPPTKKRRMVDSAESLASTTYANRLYQGTRFVLASTDHLHTKIGEMGQRIRQLEDALAIFQASTGSNETHPLLRDELLSIKFGPEKASPTDKPAKSKEPSIDSIDALGTLTIGDDGDGKFGKYFGRSAGSEAGAEMEMSSTNDFADFPPLSVEIARLSNSFPFSSGVLFMLFALGALVDLTLEPHNAESDRYYHASRAAMALRSVFDSPEMATVQAVLLMATYHNMGGRSYTMESSWSLMCLGSKVNRDSARWNMDPKTVNRRRSLFWELFSAELFQSVALGRPPSIRLSYVDCEFPLLEDQSLDENGKPRVGYYEWKYSFTRDIFSVISERTLTAESPTYETVLELDRLVRAKTLPPYLNVFLGREDENCTPSVYMRGCLLGQYRSIALLYIHRTFFAQAMLDHPVNPLRSPYAPSFLAAYRCASGMIKANLNHFERFPELCCRWWVVWTHLGCIVTRSPSSSMAPTAFIELGLACDLFEKGAKVSRRARSGLAILCKLREKAFQVYSQFRSGNPAPSSAGFGPGLFDYGEDELALFGGQTRVMVSKLISRTDKSSGKEKEKDSNSSNPNVNESHLPSLPSATPSTSSSVSTPSTSSEPMPDVHPSLVEYLSLFPPSQHPSPSSQDNSQLSQDAYHHEMGGQSASHPGTTYGYDQTFFDQMSLPAPQYYVDPDTPPKDIADLGMLMSGESGIDEQWKAFMKKSFSGLLDEHMPTVPTNY